MILYDPTSGLAVTTPMAFRPRTCFFMGKLGKNAPPIVTDIRKRLVPLLGEVGYSLIDAGATTTGKDFLRKVWGLLVSVPMGIAVVYRGMPGSTLGNVFYELGLMQALGKETLVVREPDATVPSDFIRTEYVLYGEGFDAGIRQYIRSALEWADSLCTIAETLERDPLLAIDCYRRAFLLTGDEKYCRRTDELVASGEIGARARNSVELLAASFRDIAGKVPEGETAKLATATAKT